MTRTLGAGLLTLCLVGPIGQADSPRTAAARGTRELITELSSADPVQRAQAACDLRRLGDGAFDAMQPLVDLLADAAPVPAATCRQGSWRGDEHDTTTPGELAASALVAIGTRAFQPLLTSLRATAWPARRNAAWGLGALDDQRAVSALVDALKDREPSVREQVAWALGAIDDPAAVEALSAALKDTDPRVRRQAAWALGAIDDTRAVPALVRALSDESGRVREQAAWALGAIGDPRAISGLMNVLKDPESSVRRQAAWAIGAIGK